MILLAAPNPLSVPAAPRAGAARARPTRDGLVRPFRWFALCMGVFVVAYGAAMTLFITTVAAHLGGAPVDEAALPGFLRGAVLALVGLLAAIPAMVGGLVAQAILLFRAWELVQDGHARTTPGRAAGLLFIPLFNFYWYFVAKFGLAKDLNAYAARHRIAARRVSPALGLASSILLPAALIPYLGLVLLVPAYVVVVCFLRQVVAAAGDIAETTAAPDLA